MICIDLNLHKMTTYYCDWFCLEQENKSYHFIIMHNVVYFITICYLSQYSLKKIINSPLLQCPLCCLLWEGYAPLLY